MAAKIASAFKQNMTELTLVPYDDGRFEIFIGDERMHSKLKTGDFPDEDTLVAKMQRR